MEDQPESFYTTFDTDREDIAYSDKGFNKVVVNFVRIKTSYLKYHSSFFSKSKLYKHIKTGCIREVLTSSFTQLSSSILVIASTAIYQLFDLSLAFRSWIYATIAITLDPHRLPQNSDPESMACFDTGCKVTLIDKGWLLRYFPKQKISTMSTLLKVRGIRASRHESKEFVALSLYFLGKNSARKLVYALLRYKIHLVKGLRANLLIKNDIILPKNFVINIEKKTILIKSCGVIVFISVRQKR